MTPDPSAVPLVVWVTGTDFDTFAEVQLLANAMIILLLTIIAVVVAFHSRAA